MQHLSDTPPDGDFARYVEQLSAQAALTVQDATLTRPASPARVFPPGPARPATQPVGTVSPTGSAAPSLGAGLRWAVVAWVAIQLLAAFVPALGMLTLPLFAGVAAWLVYRLKRGAGRQLQEQWQQWAARATEEIKQRK